MACKASDLASAVVFSNLLFCKFLHLLQKGCVVLSSIKHIICIRSSFCDILPKNGKAKKSWKIEGTINWYFLWTVLLWKTLLSCFVKVDYNKKAI